MQKRARSSSQIVTLDPSGGWDAELKGETKGLQKLRLMATDRLQLQRFELKYFITEETALHVRRFVRSYLEIDEFGATQPNLAYPSTVCTSILIR
ncbi:MAG: hypothetical protein L0Z50_42165 [Verrucomicrobiales bacterium]|nr:hypothetical protein [Verrucomicrobiales bacterium]